MGKKQYKKGLKTSSAGLLGEGDAAGAPGQWLDARVAQPASDRVPAKPLPAVVNSDVMAEPVPAHSESLKCQEERAPVANIAAPLNCEVKVDFVLLEPDARQVFLCGDFNGWAPGAMPMRRQADGQWKATIALAPGRHEYKFWVDGSWLPDVWAPEQTWNSFGTLNSVINVRAC